MFQSLSRSFGHLLWITCAVFIIAAALILSGCTKKKKQVWIYTSMYKEMAAELTPGLKQAFPDVEIQWFSAGSENVASKVNAELAAGHSKADIIHTSDPFWYLELKAQKQLMPYESPATRTVPAKYRDPDHAFVNLRTPLMVIGYNEEAVPGSEAPKSWKDLGQSRWKDKLSMGSPLESGTSFTLVALLSRLYQWDYFVGLKKLGLVAAGGNSSVQTRMETRERPVGAVLLENILNGRKKGSPVREIYPSDGTIPIPSPIAILKDRQDPELIKRVYDHLFSEAAQRAIVKFGVHSALPEMASPEGTPSWPEMEKKLITWSPEILNEVYLARQDIKSRFSEVMWR